MGLQTLFSSASSGSASITLRADDNILCVSGTWGGATATVNKINPVTGASIQLGSYTADTAKLLRAVEGAVINVVTSSESETTDLTATVESRD